MQARDINKLYYSISEVSEITGLKQYVLRYWEAEFPNIKPDKNRAGNRVYKEKDIENLKKSLSRLKFKIILCKSCYNFALFKNQKPHICRMILKKIT